MWLILVQSCHPTSSASQDVRHHAQVKIFILLHGFGLSSRDPSGLGPVGKAISPCGSKHVAEESYFQQPGDREGKRVPWIVAPGTPLVAPLPPSSVG